MTTKRISYLNRLRRNTDLPTQLLVSHLLAMALGALPVIAFSRLYKNGIGDVLEVVIGVLLSVALMSFSTGRLIVQPVKALEETMKNFEINGSQVPQVESGPVPELYRLGLGFNYLAESLQSAEKRRHQLTSSLMHELCTPLTVLRGELEMVQRQRRELTPEVCHKLLQQTIRLTQLTQNMLTLSKGESGQLPINRQIFSLRPMLQDVQAKLTPALFKSSCQVQLNCPTNLPSVFSDRDWVEQILTNLISNAIRYTPEGIVRVRAWVSNDYVWVAVTDTGIGIAVDELPHIFEHYWRSERARRLVSGGSGIGLSVVQQLVRLQTGQIEVRSELGKGSMFRFSIPLA